MQKFPGGHCLHTRIFTPLPLLISQNLILPLLSHFLDEGLILMLAGRRCLGIIPIIKYFIQDLPLRKHTFYTPSAIAFEK